jgi:hypothetical protein
MVTGRVRLFAAPTTLSTGATIGVFVLLRPY